MAECDLCARACPTGALRATPAGLELSPAQCSGCAACGAACPAAALTVQGAAPLPPGTPDAAGALLLVCPMAAPGDAGTLCLQALGLRALAALWLRGVRQLWLRLGDCAACPSGAGLDAAAPLAVINALLADRGLPGLELRPAPQRPRARLPRLGEGGASAARRGFLRLTAAGDDSRAALQRLQGLAPGGARMAFVPRIDAARCTACHACTRLCPEGALMRIKDEAGGMAYQIDAARCSGCGICVAACQEDAICIETLVCPQDGRVTLHAGLCRGCGLPFHATTAGGALCPTCRRAPHFRKLHQVLA